MAQLSTPLSDLFLANFIIIFFFYKHILFFKIILIWRYQFWGGFRWGVIEISVTQDSNIAASWVQFSLSNIVANYRVPDIGKHRIFNVGRRGNTEPRSVVSWLRLFISPRAPCKLYTGRERSPHSLCALPCRKFSFVADVKRNLIQHSYELIAIFRTFTLSH